MPIACAALGTSEWLVIPGAVFTSNSQLLPAPSRITSTRPQPLQPSAWNACSASARSCASAAASSRPGQTYWVSVARYLARSEEHTSELQSLMRSSYAVFCLKKKTQKQQIINSHKITSIRDNH